MSVIVGIVDSFQITGTRVLFVVEYSAGGPVTIPTNLTFWSEHIPLVGIQATTSPTFIYNLQVINPVHNFVILNAGVVPDYARSFRDVASVLILVSNLAYDTPHVFKVVVVMLVSYQVTDFHRSSSAHRL